MLGAVADILTLATALPGTKLLPSQTSASPVLGAALVVSTSLKSSILLSANAVSKSA